MRLNPEVTADLVTFTEEIPNGKLYFFVHCNLIINHTIETRNTTSLKINQRYPPPIPPP